MRLVPINEVARRADLAKITPNDPEYMQGTVGDPSTPSIFILACTNSDPPMESLRDTLDTFTLVAQMAWVEHDANINDDARRSQRNRTTGDAAAVSSANIEDEDDDATATSMNAPEALSNMELCNVACR